MFYINASQVSRIDYSFLEEQLEKNNVQEITLTILTHKVVSGPSRQACYYNADGVLVPPKPGEVLKREFDVLVPSDSSSRSALLDRLNKLRQEFEN